MRKLATLGIFAAFVLSMVSCEQAGGPKREKEKKMNQRSRAQVERAAR